MKRTLWIFLFLTGITFLFSACDRHPHRGHHGFWGGKMVEKISDELDLSKEQKEKLQEIQKDFQALHQKHRAEHQTWGAQLAEEIRKDRIAPKKLEEMAMARSQHHQEVIQQFSGRISDFHASLNKEQKEKLAKWLEKWTNHGKD